MKSKRIKSRESMIERVREQVQRGIVYEIRRRQDVAQILNGYTTDPRVVDDILLIINFEEAEPQIAGVKCQRRKRQHQEAGNVTLPRPEQEWLGRITGFPLLALAIWFPKLWFKFGLPGFRSSSVPIGRHLGLLSPYKLGFSLCHDSFRALNLQGTMSRV